MAPARGTIIMSQYDFNKVILTGRLGNRPELKQTPSGSQYVRFSLATHRVVGSKEERKERTSWHNVIAWGGLAELCERYLDKGSSLLVEGRLESRDYTKDDQKKQIVEVIAENIQFLGSPKSSQKNNTESVDLLQ